MRRNVFFLIAGIGLAASLGACATETHADRRDTIVQPPDEYRDDQIEGLETNHWCSDFKSPGLEEAVRRTWEQNLELKAAWARLEQAKAQLAQSRSHLWPELNTEAGVSISNDTESLPDSLQGRAGGGPDIGTRWEASMAASYEVDLWGKYRHRAKAAKLDVRAQRWNARSLAMTLTSNVAEAWFDVVTARQRLDLIDDQIELSKRFLELTKVRFRQGLAAELDISQQEQNLEALRGERVDAKLQLERHRNRLAVLTGKEPSQLQKISTADLPELPKMPDPGVPADLLKRRPDIRASLSRLKAADQRTAAAVADRLPTLNLTASLFLQADKLGELLDELVWSASAMVGQTIFDGGRLKAAQREAESVAEERLYQYGHTLLEALEDVQNALVGEKQQKQRLKSLRREHEIAQESLEAARAQYRQGNIDYLRVLDVLQRLQQLEQNILEARRKQLSYRVSLCRAIGGSWANHISPKIPK